MERLNHWLKQAEQEEEEEEEEEEDTYSSLLLKGLKRSTPVK